jgi:hypothetical protein
MNRLFCENRRDTVCARHASVQSKYLFYVFYTPVRFEGGLDG